ncbi:dnaJ homolog subfamily B member 1 [Drosophila serrata]|uniref:dnaJ homolog subfamily B member 1 n=1 Tax=Drosophila serrata TaxID=7274 RepID=UPI000A1D0B00|nr:dnaJ homolog subfamily B member 1 [Drosophila serrata]
MKNFYEVLGIGRGASEDEIRKSYHQLALRYHPDKNKNSDAERIFKIVGQAYKVLSDSNQRAAYDQILQPEQTLQSEQTLQPEQTFQSNQTLQTMLKPGSRKLRRLQDPDIMIDLPVSLEQIATGCTKLWKFQRQEIMPDGRLVIMDKTLQIYVCPGCPSNTKIVFYKEGNQVLNRIPANIVFTVRDIPHPSLIREGHNLIFKVKISQMQALYGVDIKVPTLQGCLLNISIFGSVIKPGSTHHIKGGGLPYPGSEIKGDIVVCFEIM